MKEPEFNDRYAYSVVVVLILVIVFGSLSVFLFGCVSSNNNDIPPDAVSAIDKFLLHLPKK